jgi:hypothetical protein
MVAGRDPATTGAAPDTEYEREGEEVPEDLLSTLMKLV